MSSEPPPLTPAEARRLVTVVAPAAAEHELVLIGGQAISFWQARLADYLPPEHRAIVASKDLDFQGKNDRAVRAAAVLLDGEARIPRWDHHSPMIGLVAFKDADGYERQLDVLPAPYGIASEQVSSRAVSLPLGEQQTVRVLHPVDCLRSRVANSSLPSKQHDRAWRQLDAAIRIVPAYGLSVLDAASSEETKSALRLVTNLNEAVFNLAFKNHVARKLYEQRGVDAAQALLRDPRLPEAHLKTRFPQMEQLLDQRRSYSSPVRGSTADGSSSDRRIEPERSDGYDLGL